jgi:hypothetical protein
METIQKQMDEVMKNKETGALKKVKMFSKKFCFTAVMLTN